MGELYQSKVSGNEFWTNLVFHNHLHEPLPGASGLLSLWRFEDNGNLGLDTVGSNNLTNNNGATQTTGKVGEGLELDWESSQYLSIASNASMEPGTGDFWFAFWGNLGITASRTWLARGQGSAANTSYYFASGGFPIITVSFVVSDGTSFFSSGLINASFEFAFYMAWYDKTLNKVCIRKNNGSIVSATGPTAPVNMNTIGFTLGSGPAGASAFGGILDEVAWGKLSAGSLGDGTAGTLANRISETLYNGGDGLAWPW